MTRSMLVAAVLLCGCVDFDALVRERCAVIGCSDASVGDGGVDAGGPSLDGGSSDAGLDAGSGDGEWVWEFPPAHTNDLLVAWSDDAGVWLAGAGETLLRRDSSGAFTDESWRIQAPFDGALDSAPPDIEASVATSAGQRLLFGTNFDPRAQSSDGTFAFSGIHANAVHAATINTDDTLCLVNYGELVTVTPAGQSPLSVAWGANTDARGVVSFHGTQCVTSLFDTVNNAASVGFTDGTQVQLVLDGGAVPSAGPMLHFADGSIGIAVTGGAFTSPDTITWSFRAADDATRNTNGATIDSRGHTIGVGDYGWVWDLSTGATLVGPSSGENLVAAVSTGANELLAVGRGGAVVRLSGLSSTVATQDLNESCGQSNALTAVSIAADGTVWAVGTGSLVYRKPRSSRWAPVQLTATDLGDLYAVVARSATEAFIGDSRGLHRVTGASVGPNLLNPDDAVYGLASDPSQDVIVVMTETAIYTYAPSRSALTTVDVSSLPPHGRLQAIAAYSGTMWLAYDAVGGGAGAVVSKSINETGSWNVRASLPASPWSVSASAGGVAVVGSSGLVQFGTGGDLTPRNIATDQELHSVIVFDDGSMTVTSSRGAVFHSVASQWVRERVHLQEADGQDTVIGGNEHDRYLVGRRCGILHSTQ